ALALRLKEGFKVNFNKLRAASKRRTNWRHPRLEALEGRVVLFTIHVNTFADTVAKNPMVSPVDKSGTISLRSAIQFADANPTKSDTIILQAGTYNLTIAPSLTLTNCFFSGNAAIGGNGSFGGDGGAGGGANNR